MVYTKILLVIWGIHHPAAMKPDKEIEMPDMPTCLKRLEHYKPEPNEFPMCEYMTYY